jgi:hypothetical protein
MTTTKKTSTPKAKKNKAAAEVHQNTETVEVSPVSAWKKASRPQAMTMPSGNVMKIRRVKFETFMKTGIIPNSLMAIVQDAINKGTDPDKVDLEIDEIMDDTSKIGDLFTMIDEVVIFCAVEPAVHRVPAEEKDRDDELLYVDEIDQDDKAFIFNLSQGGTDDVSQFRSEQADSVAALQGRPALVDASKSVVGSDV